MPLLSCSNKSWTRPSAASMGTLSADSASATRAGKGCVRIHTPLSQGSCWVRGPTVTHAHALSTLPRTPLCCALLLPLSAPSLSPGEGTRATAPRPHPSTTKPASARGIRSRARGGASACAGSASATPRTRPCASTAPSASSTCCSARAPPASSATVRAPQSPPAGACAGSGGTDGVSWTGGTGTGVE